MKTYLYGIINIGASAFRMAVSEVGKGFAADEEV